MKLIKILTAFIALASLQIAAAQWLNVPPPAEAKNLMIFTAGVPVVGSSKVSFTEDWNCSDADSPDCDLNWTEDAGDQDISGSKIYMASGSYATNLLIAGANPLSTANGYIKVQIYPADGYPNFIFRYTNSASHYYKIEYAGGTGWDWSHCANSSTSCDQIGTTQSWAGIEAGDYMGITWTGTGANTDIRTWRNPTANAPISATEWDSGDSTPDAAWTATDPGANAVDTGAYVGIGGVSSVASNISLDNFYAGDIP